MDCKFIIVGSVTFAMKARGELESRGIACKIEKIKKVKALNGCGYGLKVRKSDVSSAVRYLSLARIKIIETIDC